MMSLVVDQLINLLAAPPDAVLAAGHIGDHVPATSGDLPGISVSLVLDPPRGNGIGQFVREGHQLVQNTAVIEVAVTADTFTADLKTLRILPLPLKRNPSSHTANF